MGALAHASRSVFGTALLALSVIRASAQSDLTRGDSARLARMIALADLPAGSRMLSEHADGSGVVRRRFTVGTVAIYLSLYEFPSDSARDASFGPAVTAEMAAESFRSLVQQRGFVVEGIRAEAFTMDSLGPYRRGFVVSGTMTSSGLRYTHAYVMLDRPTTSLFIQVEGLGTALEVRGLLQTLALRSASRLELAVGQPNGGW